MGGSDGTSECRRHKKRVENFGTRNETFSYVRLLLEAWLLLNSNKGQDSKSRDTLLVPAAPRPVVWATRKITTETFSTAQVWATL